jgi:hypothetical protein
MLEAFIACTAYMTEALSHVPKFVFDFIDQVTC